MRYLDDEGRVWSTIAQFRDAASKHLCGVANCFIAYPRLTAAPTHRPKFTQPVELNCYDISQQGLDAAELFINDNNIKVVCSLVRCRVH